MRSPLRSTRTLVPVLLAWIAVATTLEAQTIASPYRFIDERHEISLFGGVIATNRGTHDVGPGEGPLFGARYTFDVSGVLAIEGALFYLAVDRDVYDPSDPDSEPAFVGVADQHIGLLEGRARFNVMGGRSWHRLAPYLIGGGGIAWDVSGDSEVEANVGAGSRFRFGPSLVGGLGAGVRWLFGENLGARVEGSVGIWKIGIPPGFVIDEEAPGPVDGGEWVGWSTLTVGASYRF